MDAEFSIFKGFRQIILWGFPLHTHTHSYIHGAWVKTFKHLGFNTFWFHDKDFPEDFDYSNTLFITEGWADDNIPLRGDCTYFVHIAKNPAKYLEIGARLIEIRYNVHEIQDFNYSYTLPDSKRAIYLSQDTLYERLEDDSAVAFRRGRMPSRAPYEAVYMYWATDLLPHEFNYDDAGIMRSNENYFIGSGNEFMQEFKRDSEATGHPVITVDPWSKPVSYEENIRLMKLSYCCPDFRSRGSADKFAEYGKMNGTNHLDIGYIPCRVLKAISYGQTGITNSPRVKELLGEHVEYVENSRDIIGVAKRRMDDVEWRKAAMRHVAERHTFLQRARDLARALAQPRPFARPRVEWPLTFVTSMFDIGRAAIDGRTMSEYKEWLLKTLAALPMPVVLFLDKKLDWTKEILAIRGGAGPIKIVERDLTELDMWKYKETVKKVLSSPRQTKYPNDITNRMPEYCLIQYSKFFFLEEAIKENWFGTEYYSWIDGGYSRFFDKPRNYIDIKLMKTLKFGIETGLTNLNEIIGRINPDNYIGSNERILYGGFWTFNKNTLLTVKNGIIDIWEEEMLKKNRIDNEQIALALLYKKSPEFFTVVLTDNTNFYSRLFT